MQLGLPFAGRHTGLQFLLLQKVALVNGGQTYRIIQSYLGQTLKDEISFWEMSTQEGRIGRRKAVGPGLRAMPCCIGSRRDHRGRDA